MPLRFRELPSAGERLIAYLGLQVYLGRRWGSLIIDLHALLAPHMRVRPLTLGGSGNDELIGASFRIKC